MPNSFDGVRHWFNEYEPHAAAWLRGLMDHGLIPRGTVDERSITELQAEDVAGETCHFFAGIGGWDHALRLAGWPIDRPVWTGSCPCQPFSSAGAKRGTDDERDLWPHFYRLIRECRPDVVFGEQVANAIKFGWLDRVCTDLEREGYTVGAVVLGAHSVGAPHQRQRLYWVATRGVGHSKRNGVGRNGGTAFETEGQSDRGGFKDGNVCLKSAMSSSASGVGNSDVHERNATDRRHGDSTHAASCAHRCGFWEQFEFVNCADGKARRIEPGVLTVVDGVPFRLADGRTVEGVSRAATLKGIGNAIVPQVAAEFVRAFLEAEKELQ